MSNDNTPWPERFWRNVNIKGDDDCWHWTAALCSHGYGKTYYLGKHMKAHRAVMVITHGAIPDGMHVLHRCDNPVCVNPNHLFFGTHSDNFIDCRDKGRLKTPLGHGNTVNAKITAQDVRDIAREQGVPNKDLAAKYNLVRTQITKITKGHSWKQV